MAIKRFMLILTVSALTLVPSQAQMGGGASPIAAGSSVEPSLTFNTLLSETEGSMMRLVKAMPAEKYSFAPSAAIFAPSQHTDFAGVRTFSALVVHVAQANYGIGMRIGGEKPTVDVKALGDLKEKDEVIAALAASFAYVHKQIDTLTPATAMQSVRGPATHAALAVAVTVHAADEYGQMVEYARMNGIVPPASQK